jgi:hypothetical protein
LLAGRMLMTLTASFPKVTNTTTITPRMFLPMPAQRLLYEGTTSARCQKSLIEIGEVQTVLCKVGEALRFIP